MRTRRYACAECSGEISSRFVFDGLVFDSEYFRTKMIEHRHRKRELRARVREALLGTRSGRVHVEPINLLGVPGLVEALDGLTANDEKDLDPPARGRFDLPRYQRRQPGIGHP